jgi:8-amino-7-oxononanoate synthase
MNAKRQIEQSLRRELQALDARDQLRTLEISSGINLCSNDYLGLSTHPELRQAVLEAIASGARLASTGSRLLSGHAREWDEVETEFASFVGLEDALYFTSGYAANVGVLSAITGKSDIIFSDELNHASLIDGIRLSGAQKVIYPHCDVDALDAALCAVEATPVRKFIVTESVFSMDGDLAPLAEICALAERHGAAVIVDEAHAVGVFGPEGRGRIAQLGLAEKIFACVYPCGKALASAGAFVCGSSELKDILINRARPFIFNTALPPYFAAQVQAVIGLARKADAQRARLAEIARAVREKLRALGFDIGRSDSQIVPLILGDNAAAIRCAQLLAEGGFTARAIRPPTVPESSARLRISLTCTLQDSEIRTLLGHLERIRTQLAEKCEAAGAAAR